MFFYLEPNHRFERWIKIRHKSKAYDMTSESLGATQSTSDNNKTGAPTASFDNFFALFEQPIQFELSQAELDQRLRHLQKRYHPDNIAKNNADTAKVQQQSEQASSLINQGYQTLSAHDSRAAYLLDMAGQAQNVEQSIADLDFLEDAMQMRIDLDEAIDNTDRPALEQLHPQAIERLQKQSERFNSAYQQQDWQTAIDATQKLKFLVKLDADITSGLDDVASAAQSDDDDLYV